MGKAATDANGVAFANRAGWEEWLEKNHNSSPGVWLVIAKMQSGIASVSYAEALEVALTYGWIDGQRRSLDGLRWRQRFVPRGPSSIWSQKNREAVKALIARGRMKPSGLLAVQRARDSGRWAEAYEGQAAAEVPADLAAELAIRPRARDFFDALDSRNRYAVLFRLRTARKPETRAKRLKLFVEMLERGDKIYP